MVTSHKSAVQRKALEETEEGCLISSGVEADSKRVKVSSLELLFFSSN